MSFREYLYAVEEKPLSDTLISKDFSLIDNFSEKYKPSLSVRFSLLPYKNQDWMINIPLYAVCSAVKL